MCGLAGFLEPGRRLCADSYRATASRMADAILHRGPDDAGIWVDEDAGVGLGHRRLSILDLSPEGHQPMLSANGRYALVFNGEIYNFASLRAELAGLGHGFRGGSDTEVMLAAFTQWGCLASLGRFTGMFAFALWDREERVLHLSRDRFGEKPLYYGWSNGSFLFGSELKALAAHPRWRGEINRDVIPLLLRYNCIPAPYSIYRDIHKLPPGTLLTLKAAEGALPTFREYWSATAAACAGFNDPLLISDAEATAELDKRLRQVVRQQMVSDVPLGAFLSGGVDSSAIVALMQAQSSNRVRTFTIGFEEKDYDESDAARAVAAHLGTEHTELRVSAREAMAVIPRLAAIYDEPFSDSSQIPTLLIAGLARRHVTVSLSGDGGDELFAGYNRYLWAERIWGQLRVMPLLMRKLAARGLGGVGDPALQSLFELIAPLAPEVRQPLDKLHKILDLLDSDSIEDIYLRLRSHNQHPASLVPGSQEPDSFPLRPPQWPSLGKGAAAMQCVDALTYLPDDILTKVDRASMAVGLEARVPFLDHHLFEFAWRLPAKLRIRDGQGKWLLRQLVYKYVPRELIERPKSGFAIPIGSWLGGPLREWCESQLAPERLKRGGYFDARAVRAMWQEHLSGARDWQHRLWDILMFQAWLERIQKTAQK
ncbi:MAG: asparagine synthase (glutamine-hydrolyzing) [Deltaproteobacteria bacterium]|nr:asparagine synthase (glutamine-hydrolyzing) [Deltaproteobacteria bacterium]